MEVLEQKSCLLEYKIYTTILKNPMQKTSDTIIGEKPITCYQKQKNITNISTIQDVIDVSHKWNFNIDLILLNFHAPFTE